MGGREGGREPKNTALNSHLPLAQFFPQKARQISQPYLFREMKQRSFFPVTNTSLGGCVIRPEEMSGTSGRKRAAFVFCSENVITDLFTLTADHDSAVTSVLHTDQWICSKMSNVNCLGSEKSVTWVSGATTIYIGNIQIIRTFQGDVRKDSS